MLGTDGSRWKPIFPQDERYWVSDDGRVASLVTGMPYMLALRSGGHTPFYQYVTLPNPAGGRSEQNKQARKPYMVHHLVLHAFGEPRPSRRHETRHLDGNTMNNHISNLVWGTPKENAADKVLHGTHPKGNKHYRARLNDGEVRVIRKLSLMKVTRQRIADIFGVSMACIKDIRSGRRWASVR